MKSGGFTGWQVVAFVFAGVSPFWFLASNLKDGSEAKATLLGAAIVGVIVGIIRTVRGR